MPEKRGEISQTQITREAYYTVETELGLFNGDKNSEKYKRLKARQEYLRELLKQNPTLEELNSENPEKTS